MNRERAFVHITSPVLKISPLDNHYSATYPRHTLFTKQFEVVQ
jgi:hypothetical protein